MELCCLARVIFIYNIRYNGIYLASEGFHLLNRGDVAIGWALSVEGIYRIMVILHAIQLKSNDDAGLCNEKNTYDSDFRLAIFSVYSNMRFESWMNSFCLDVITTADRWWEQLFIEANNSCSYTFKYFVNTLWMPKPWKCWFYRWLITKL